jgi:hypothetical protein
MVTALYRLVISLVDRIYQQDAWSHIYHPQGVLEERSHLRLGSPILQLYLSLAKVGDRQESLPTAFEPTQRPQGSHVAANLSGRHESERNYSCKEQGLGREARYQRHEASAVTSQNWTAVLSAATEGFDELVIRLHNRL